MRKSKRREKWVELGGEYLEEIQRYDPDIKRLKVVFYKRKRR